MSKHGLSKIKMGVSIYIETPKFSIKSPGLTMAERKRAMRLFRMESRIVQFKKSFRLPTAGLKCTAFDGLIRISW